MSTFAERLTEALKTSKKTRAALAKRLYSDTKQALGVSSQAVGQALDGTTKSLSANNCARAARFLDVDFYWLATGEGVARPQSMAEASIEQVIYRLGVLLTGMDELSRTTASTLLTQLALRPEDAQRIAEMARSISRPAAPAPASVVNALTVRREGFAIRGEGGEASPPSRDERSANPPKPPPARRS